MDRLRLEVAYAGGEELYAWPESGAFEHSIEELLPSHGLVSNGSYAIHIRTLFVRDVARFGQPRTEDGRVRLDATVPAALSGFALTTSAGSVPAGLDATVWLNPSRLDLERLEVRVSTRLAQSIETTTYGRVRIGEVEFVVPEASELLLWGSDGTQLRNVSRFDRYHRYVGTATITYDTADHGPAAPGTKTEPARAGAKIAGVLDAPIPAGAAIGDPFTITAEGGAKLTGRVAGMHRSGRSNWEIELTLQGRVLRARLPLAEGTRLTFGKM